jgi:hypothetical protein
LQKSPTEKSPPKETKSSFPAKETLINKTIALPPTPPITHVKKPSITHKMDLTPEEEQNEIKKALENNPDIPTEIPIKQKIGKFGLMWPRLFAIDHEASNLLSSYAEQGCPVDCGPNWSKKHIELSLQRGPHISAKQKLAAAQLQLETAEKIKHGYARTVKWKTIKNNIPEKLKISPIAMIPHKSRKFRAILDLSFNLFHKGRKYTSVNETTKPKSMSESMTQLGQTIKRIVATMAQNHNTEKPFKFAKIDIKDGFWRMAVNDTNAWNFCYVLPDNAPNIDEITIVVPNSLQMGWCESPPFFCASTETARDIIDMLISSNANLPQHWFEKLMLPTLPEPTELNSTTAATDTTLVEVFVDDFIGATNNTSPAHLTKVSRAMIHGVHSIFPPPDISGHNGQDPVSEPKLNKGEGHWDHEKEVLGWVLNGKTFTLHLPKSKCEAIRQLINKITSKKRVSLNKFQKLAGKLQHASFGIPGGAGLFSPIQRAMSKNPDFINITKELITILHDWRYMIHFMTKNPTSVLQLIVDYPHYIGYSDSCGLGTGGIWSSGVAHMDPILWHLEWPEDIKKNALYSN